MSVTRRDFLKLTGTVAAGAVIGSGVPLLTGCSPSTKKTKGSKRKNAICPFCSLGCGLRLYIRKGKVVHLDGDPEHPVNRGSICAKALLLVSANGDGVRLDRVRYRKAGADNWETLSWDRALDMITERFKALRDSSFIQEDGGVAVNRVESIAGIAGSSLSNEEGYLFNKFFRLAGCSSIGTESLLKGGAFASALTESFGLPSQTNPWTDIRNAGAVLVLGSNPSRCMPVAMRHILDGRSVGGKLIVADPAVTETASVSDLHCRIRPGTDAAFLLGLVNHAISANAINREYVIEYTDAPCILRTDFDYDIATSLFSGYDAGKKQYSAVTWEYERDERGNPRKDDELRNLRTVFQAMKRIASRYTPAYVSLVTGCSEESFMRAAELFFSGVASGRPAAIVLGSGVEGHARAAQTVRAASVLLLLTGNIGVSGGGIYITAGGANSRGVDDQIPSWGMMPGSIPLPKNNDEGRELDSAAYVKNNAPVTNDPMSLNLRQYFRNYSVSQLKAFFGDYATKETRFGFDLLPKSGGADSASEFYKKLSSGAIKGLFLLGGGSFHDSSIVSSLSRLEWLVVSDIWDNDAAGFWKGSGAQNRTEVFLLPSMTLPEKGGTTTSSSRWVELSDKISPANNQARSELWMLDALFKRLLSLYRAGGVFAEPFLRAHWNYGEADEKQVRLELGGMHLASGKPIASLSGILGDGSTACGNMLYCGLNSDDGPGSRDDGGRSPRTSVFPSWGWAAPSNVRILYNRAGVDRKGSPWSGIRVVDLEKNRSGLDCAHGKGAASAHNPFVMTREGLGRIFAPLIEDGPLPDHAEPEGSGFSFGRKGSGSSKPSAVAVHSGMHMMQIWKNIPDSAECFPEGYCEISPSFAAAKNISQGDELTVTSRRGNGTFRALVTPRISPLVCDGVPVDVVSLRGRGAARIVSSAAGEDSQYTPVDIKVSGKRGIL
jgi:formate dehydrogenase major subunit